MKTGFNNSQCAHIWAQQSQPFGRSDSMEFDGAVIKSYQTPIAAFVPSVKTRKGGLLDRVVLVTSDSYSMTTSGKHMPAVRAAIRGSLSFTVPDIGHGGGRAQTLRLFPASDFHSYKAVHKFNLAWLVEQYRKEVARLLKSQPDADYQPGAYDYRTASLIDAEARIRNYAKAFGVKILKRHAVELSADLVAIRSRWLRLASDPKRQARIAAREAQRRDALRMAAERADALSAANLEKWRAHEYRGSISGTTSAALRVTRDGSSVQTSWGATITAKEAREFAFFWACHREGGWRNGPDAMVSVGPFPLREIAAGSGDCTIGCHKISGEEIYTAARTLGVLE